MPESCPIFASLIYED